MARRRRWTDAEKAAAVAAVRELGIAGAHERTGIPKPRLSTWAKANGERTFATEQLAAAVETVKLTAAQRRAALSDRLLNEVETELDRLRGEVTETRVSASGAIRSWTESEPNAGDRRAIATTTAILLDKHLLLDGQATSRVETIDTQAAKQRVTELQDDWRRRADERRRRLAS